MVATIQKIDRKFLLTTVVLVIYLVFTPFVSILFFLPNVVYAMNAPVPSIDTLDVYESSTRALGDGTAVCTGVSLTSASECTGTLTEGNTYQFQVTVSATAANFDATQIDFESSVAAGDVLGSIVVGDLDTGCNDDGADEIWTDSIVGDIARGSVGAQTCRIAAAASDVLYFIVTIDTDAVDGQATATFFVTNGTETDQSTVTTFNVAPPAAADPGVAITVSGTLYTDDGVTPDTSGSDTIQLRVATTTPGVHTATTDTNGFFEFTEVRLLDATGTPMMIYLDGGSAFAAAITKASTTFQNITNIPLYTNRVVVQDGSNIDSNNLLVGTSTTNADFSFFDVDDDPDVPYSADGGALDIKNGMELHIATSTHFEPGGNVTIHGNTVSVLDGDLHLSSDAATSSIITLGATDILTVGGSWFASSSIFNNSGTLIFSASTTGKTILGELTGDSSLASTTFEGSGGTGGAWSFNEGGNASNASTTELLISSGGTVTAPSSGLLSISGDLVQDGTYTNNSATILFDGTAAQSFSGTMVNTSALGNVLFSAGSTKTFGANSASTTNLTISSGSGAVTAPSTLLSVSGNYTNNGTFTHNSGTVLLDGTAQQTLSGNMTESGGTVNAFNNLTISNTIGEGGGGSPAQSIIFSASASTTATLTMLASTSAQFLANATSTFTDIDLQGATDQYVWLRSSTDGTEWGLVVTGTQSITFTDVRDSNACSGNPNIDATDGTNVDSTGNFCWDFVAAAPPPGGITIAGTLYSDEGLTERTGGGDTIQLRVATSTPGVISTSTLSGSGFFQFLNVDITDATGTPLLIWLDGGSVFASILTKATSTFTDLTDILLFQNRVIVQDPRDTIGTSTTNADFSFFDSDDDSDIQFKANSGTLEIATSTEFHIASSTHFAPGGAVTIHGNAGLGAPIDGDFHLATDSGTSSILTLGDTLTMAGSWFASSTSILNSGSFGILFNATTTGKTIAENLTENASFGSTTFDGSLGGWTFSNNASTTGDFTISAGTVVAPPTSYRSGRFYERGHVYPQLWDGVHHRLIN